MKKRILMMSILGSGLAVALHAQAQPMDQGHASHAATEPGSAAQDEARGAAQGRGVIHAIDPRGRSINLTHEPIPALGWPAMTMDLPVTEPVDLSALSPGDRVSFGLQLGSDNLYRITELKRLD